MKLVSGCILGGMRISDIVIFNTDPVEISFVLPSNILTYSRLDSVVYDLSSVPSEVVLLEV